MKVFRRNQSGLASIIVAGLIVALVSVISLGFALVASRAVQNSRNSQVGSAASYAAQSGVNDAITYLKNNPSRTVSNCSDLLKDPVPPPFNKPLAANTRYTCVLISPSTATAGPTDLSYTTVGPYKSQITKLTTNNPLRSLMVSWASTDRANNKFVDKNHAGELYDETWWKKSDHRYSPLLRLSIYPIGTAVSPDDLSPARTNYRTYYLYPIDQNSGPVTQIDYAATANGSLVNAPCGVASFTIGAFKNSNGLDCNVIINNLASTGASYYYARLTPLYQQADLKLQGTDQNSGAGSLVQFTNSQSIVDVTAQAGNAVKRLQARVVTSGSSPTKPDSFPEFAINTANTLCKRVTLDGVVATIDPASADADHCNLSLPPQQYSLAVTVIGNGNVTGPGFNCGTAGADCLETYASPTTVSLTATPDSGNSFAGWGGACSGTANPCTVDVNANQSVTATFTPNGGPYTLTVNTEDTGHDNEKNRVTSSPAGIDCGATTHSCVATYAAGTQVILTATRYSGGKKDFKHWGGDCNDSNSDHHESGGTCTLIMTKNMYVTATWGCHSVNGTCDTSTTSTTTSTSSSGIEVLGTCYCTLKDRDGHDHGCPTVNDVPQSACNVGCTPAGVGPTELTRCYSWQPNG